MTEPLWKEMAGERASGAGRLAVETSSLVKRFGRTTALAGVDVAVPEGSVYVLVGSNGAGKTTTLRTLLDLVVPDSGSAWVLGMDCRTEAARIKASVGYVPEREDLPYGWMRVGDLLRWHAAYYPAWDRAYADELQRLFSVRADARFGKLSKGHQRRVQLVLAMAHRPPVLLLDEPTDGLDPMARERAHAAFAEHLARFGGTMVVSTHQVHEAERLGDHLAVLLDGRVQAALTREALHRRLRRYRLQVPDDWSGAPGLADVVVRRNGSHRELAWTVWGEEAEVAERLRGAGATIREVETLTLAEAALALLEGRDPESGSAASTITAGAEPAHGGGVAS